MVDSIELPFGMMGRMALRNRVLGGRAHWRHLANTFEQLSAAAISKSTARVAKRPVPKVFRSVLSVFLFILYFTVTLYFMCRRPLYCLPFSLTAFVVRQTSSL